MCDSYIILWGHLDGPGEAQAIVNCARPICKRIIDAAAFRVESIAQQFQLKLISNCNYLLCRLVISENVTFTAETGSVVGSTNTGSGRIVGGAAPGHSQCGQGTGEDRSVRRWDQCDGRSGNHCASGEFLRFIRDSLG